MVKLEIRCPSCSKRGKIEVSEEAIKSTTRGLYAVNISEGIICDHSFVAYVDKNGVVRDCFMADFQIDLPISFPEQKIEEDLTPVDWVNVSLIKLNLTASLIAYTIRAMIYKKEIIILSNQNYLYDDVLRFFDYITQNSFELKISIIPKNEFNLKDLSNPIVIKGREVIYDKEGIIDPKKIRVERTFVQKFLDEYDLTSSIIILKNELQRAYKLSETIVDIVKNLKKKEKVYSRKIIDKLAEVHNVKVQMPYLDFLYEIVENYFDIKIPKSSNISNFLGTL
ncbi:hypothetical protein AC481_00185 [miscellaneous Crenarchaeota group archaeon SMTZ-80]|nr:MAG: hypothetical protein AC481_00185 [miscellaneous Crenarchaeota group archaeon SMTZ-80]